MRSHCRVRATQAKKWTKAKVLFSFPRLNAAQKLQSLIREIYKHKHSLQPARAESKVQKNKFLFQFETAEYELEEWSIIQRFFKLLPFFHLSPQSECVWSAPSLISYFHAISQGIERCHYERRAAEEGRTRRKWGKIEKNGCNLFLYLCNPR